MRTLALTAVLTLTFATSAFAQGDCKVAFLGSTQSNHKDKYDFEAIRAKGYEIVSVQDIKPEESSNFLIQEISYCGESKEDLKRTKNCEGFLYKAVGIEILNADEDSVIEVLSTPFKKARYTYQFQSALSLEERILNFRSVNRYFKDHKRYVERNLEASREIPHCNDLKI